MVLNSMLLAKVIRADYCSGSGVTRSGRSRGGDTNNVDRNVGDDGERRPRRRLSSRSDAISMSVEVFEAATDEVAHLAGLKDD